MRRSFPRIANDCLHMVVNNDPGLKAFLASNASPEAKAHRYLVLLTRSRFDVYPAGERVTHRHAQRGVRARIGRRASAATRRAVQPTCG